MTRYSVTLGRFTVTDFFDNNRYSHDPRTQFMGWGVMYNGAWDYPADTRGYTWGWMHEFHARHWSLRYASVAEPKVANGLRFDRRLFVNRGDMFEGEARYSARKHPGAVRLLGFLLHTNSGTYADAIRLAEQTGGVPEITATRRNGTLKYGVGLNVEQELTKDIGVFGRLGWNDGKTESFAFTAIDRLATGRHLRDRRALETSPRYGRDGMDGGRNFRCPRLVPGARRPGFPDRRWQASLRPGKHFRDLLLSPFISRILRQRGRCSTSPIRLTTGTAGPCGFRPLRLHLELGKETFSH